MNVEGRLIDKDTCLEEKCWEGIFSLRVSQQLVLQGFNFLCFGHGAGVCEASANFSHLKIKEALTCLSFLYSQSREFPFLLIFLLQLSRKLSFALLLKHAGTPDHEVIVQMMK